MIRFPALRTGAAISLLAVLAFSGSAVPTATPASARVNINVGLDFGGIGFGYFHRSLNRRGHWINHPRWGDVWVPPRSRGFRPYFNGYWTYSDYGLLWVGFDPWSNITDHYGRWVWDPYYHWLWIPGYVWGPGWVVWRTGGGYFGWLPMPPDYGNYDDGPYFGGRYGWDDYYGYEDWYGLSGDSFYGLWIFVGDRNFYSRDYRSHAFFDSRRVRNIMSRTTDSTRYAVEGDRIVNRSISVDRLQRLTGKRIQPVKARSLFKSDVPMATVRGGRALARQEGTGRAGPHFHDQNFQPLHTRAGKAGGAGSPLIKPETRGLGRGDVATPSGKSEQGGRQLPDRSLGEPAGDAGKGGRGVNRGSEDATPSPQPMPNAGEERARKRGSEDEATSIGKADAKRAVEMGRNRGGDNKATSSPQPLPNGGEERGPLKNPRTGEAESQGASPGAAEQGTQGRERPKAGEKKKVEEQPVNPDAEKRKPRKIKKTGIEQPANPDIEQPVDPDEDKRKKRNRDENTPER